MLQAPDADYFARKTLVFQIALAAAAIMYIVRFCALFLLKLVHTKMWAHANGTIRAADMEYVVKEGIAWFLPPKTYYLPCFNFSYVATGRIHSGRFVLFADTEKGESLMCQLVGHVIEIRYDPKDPSTWYIPAKRIRDCKVVQEIGRNTRDLKLPEK
jgi:hypothetical protein